MKRVKLLLMILVVVGFRCSHEHDFHPKEQRIQWLTSEVWVVESVINDSDGDLTSQYNNFAVAFVKNKDDGFDGDYYMTGGGKVFPEIFGKWRFGEDQTTLFLQNGREMEIVLSQNSLTLAFYAQATNGRTGGLSGHFTFKLRRHS